MEPPPNSLPPAAPPPKIPAPADPAVPARGKLEQAVGSANICWRDYENKGSPNEPQWRATLVVKLQGEELSFPSESFSKKKKAEEDACLKALAHPRIKTISKPIVALAIPLRPTTSISLLNEYCQKPERGLVPPKIEDTSDELSRLFGSKCTLQWLTGPDTIIETHNKFTSQAIARREASLLALEHLLSLPAYAPTLKPLYEQLPASERRAKDASAPPPRPPLPPLARQQRVGEPLRAASGEAHSEERRHLEFKGNDPALPLESQFDGILKTWVIGSHKNYPDREKHAICYMTAFLNAGIAGRLVLGVHDTGRVEGIPMTERQKDTLRQEWAKKLREVWPEIPHAQGILLEPDFIPVERPAQLEHPQPPNSSFFIVVFDAHPNPLPHFPYFWDRTRGKACIKNENTIAPIGATHLTQMILDASRNGATFP